MDLVRIDNFDLVIVFLDNLIVYKKRRKPLRAVVCLISFNVVLLLLLSGGLTDLDLKGG